MAAAQCIVTGELPYAARRRPGSSHPHDHGHGLGGSRGTRVRFGSGSGSAASIVASGLSAVAHTAHESSARLNRP